MQYPNKEVEEEKNNTKPLVGKSHREVQMWGFFPHSYCIYAEGSPLLTGIFKCWPSPRITDNLTEKVPLANSCLTRLLIHEFISLPFSLALQEQ